MKRNIDLASLSIGVYNRVLFKNSTELKMRQMTRVGPFSKGRASFRLVAAILYVNNKVLTARFNGRTVESLTLRNSLISKSQSFMTTDSRQR